MSQKEKKHYILISGVSLPCDLKNHKFTRAIEECTWRQRERARSRQDKTVPSGNLQFL